MATFTGTANIDGADAPAGILYGFTGGTVAELQDTAGDLFFGNAGGDVVLAGGGADLISGGAGNDHLVGGAGDDSLFGGSDSDTLQGGLGKDLLNGDDGVDTADYGDKFSSVVVTLNGSTNATVTVGGVAEDTIRNIENVLGGSGADTLTGDGLDNYLFGGAGSDTLEGGLGSDQLDGGADIDLVDYSDKTTSVVVTLSGSTNATVTVGGVAEDTIRNIENVLGGSGADALTGDGLANTLDGGAGADILKGGLGKDSLDGGAGADFADYSDKSFSVDVTLNGSTDATVTVDGVAEDTIRNIENVLGGSWGDTLTGDGLANALGGGGGGDILKGGLGKDSLDGGAGVDLADYGDKTSSVVVTLNGSTNATVTVGGVAEDTIRNVENLFGGTGADTLTGDALANGLAGFGGNDILKGGLGEDVLIGGDGADQLDGGQDNDTLFGQLGNDALSGGAGDDFLYGGVGSDALDGGAGVDAAVYNDVVASVVVTLNGSTNAVVTVGGVAQDTIRNIENVGGGTAGDVLTGDGLANWLYGGGGDDILKGGLGADRLDGGYGSSDFADYRDKTSSVVVTLNGGTDATVTVGGVAEDTVLNIENVLGGSGSDTLTGDGLANAFDGGAGDDILKGGLEKDSLDGGAGVDIADYRDKTSSVVVTLNGSTNAAVTVGGVAEDAIRNIERVFGGSGADVLTGDTLANGLAGFGGNDMLKGGLGKDSLDGGAGVDIADYRDKTSSVVVTLSGSTNATVTVGGVAEDTIRNIENVLGGSGADVLTGDGLANGLAGGVGNDLLKGGLGKDSLDGGAGVDIADYRDKTTSVVVTLNGSTNATVTVAGVSEDTIRNIENVAGGSGADTLAGDSLANAFAGGGGADRFVFTPAFGKDVITDFSASDKLVIEPSIFADWASVLGAAQQVGSDTVITASATDTITLRNFAVASLTQSQVEFLARL